MPEAVSTRAADAETATAPAPSESVAAGPGPRFRFRNIGPVKDAELELGDLTILAGKNNTGKTYIAYTLYGFLKKWQAMPQPERLVALAAAPGEPEAKGDARSASVPLRLLSRAAAEGAARRAMSPDELRKHRLSALAIFGEEFSRFDLPSVFSAPPAAFPDSACECLPGDLPADRLRSFPFSSPQLGSWRFGFDGTELELECLAPGPSPDPVSVSSLADAWFLFLFPELRLEPFALSDERFGISLFYRELDFTKSQLMSVLQQIGDSRVSEDISPFLVLEQGASRYPMPIKDNITFTRSLPDRGSERSVLWERRAHNEVRDLVGADYRVDDRGAIRLRSKARGERRFDIPLHLASSSARGLSDFYFFLKHAAVEGQLLLVDEPESHLDVANQIRLARLVSRLVRSGLRILVTTHSDYLLKEFNNLIMLHGAGEDCRDSKDLDYSPDDALDPGRVRAYIADRGRLSRCVIDHYGMNMPFFDKTIQKINRASHALTTRVRVRGGRP